MQKETDNQVSLGLAWEKYFGNHTAREEFFDSTIRGFC